MVSAMKGNGLKTGVIARLCALAVVLALIGAAGWHSLSGGWTFTESVRLDRGTYFRLKVKLDYKGAPQDFDIVVGCNVLDIDYKDGSNTHEVGLVPTVYGRRMSDGKSLVIRPPDACDGETTANGKVPADFMPLIIVYDDADTLGFGTAYISDEAYESPLSGLKFGNATIEPATHAEFVEFREKGTPNLVSRASYFGIQSDDQLQKRGLKRVWPPFGLFCHAYKRYRIPESVRPEVRKFWPADRPNYWYLSASAERGKLEGMILRSDPQRDDGGPARPWEEYSGNEYTDEIGIAKTTGGGSIGFKLYAPSFYPVSSSISSDKWQNQPDDYDEVVGDRKEIIVNQIDYLNAATRGFAYCYADLGAVISGELAYRLDREVGRVARVDEEVVAGGTNSWRSAALNLPSFFERGEYVFFDFSNRHSIRSGRRVMRLGSARPDARALKQAVSAPGKRA
jgi:hypothetical protein